LIAKIAFQRFRSLQLRAWERKGGQLSSSPALVAGRARRSPDVFPQRLADVEEVRAQHLLPETADELCAIAQSAGAGDYAHPVNWAPFVVVGEGAR